MPHEAVLNLGFLGNTFIDCVNHFAFISFAAFFCAPAVRAAVSDGHRP